MRTSQREREKQMRFHLQVCSSSTTARRISSLAEMWLLLLLPFTFFLYIFCNFLFCELFIFSGVHFFSDSERKMVVFVDGIIFLMQRQTITHHFLRKTWKRASVYYSGTAVWHKRNYIVYRVINFCYACAWIIVRDLSFEKYNQCTICNWNYQALDDFPDLLGVHL